MQQCGSGTSLGDTTQLALRSCCCLHGPPLASTDEETTNFLRQIHARASDQTANTANTVNTAHVAVALEWYPARGDNTETFDGAIQEIRDIQEIQEIVPPGAIDTPWAPNRGVLGIATENGTLCVQGGVPNMLRRVIRNPKVCKVVNGSDFFIDLPYNVERANIVDLSTVCTGCGCHSSFISSISPQSNTAKQLQCVACMAEATLAQFKALGFPATEWHIIDDSDTF